MNGFEKALTTLNGYATGRNAAATINPLVQLPVTLVFIIAVVSVPMLDAGRLVWFFCFPIVMAEAMGVGYARVFLRSLWALPFVALVGIFNPIFDTAPLWQVGTVVISSGWVSFASIVLRGLLTVQALIVMIDSCGFLDICAALRRLRVPSVLVVQLLMLYRFLTVLLDEALTMHRARLSRGFGRKNYPLRMWGTFAGQLLLRSVDRARRINRTMEARGYRGGDALLPPPKAAALRAADWAYLAAWVAIFAVIRIVDLSAIFGNILSHNI